MLRKMEFWTNEDRELFNYVLSNLKEQPVFLGYVAHNVALSAYVTSWGECFLVEERIPENDDENSPIMISVRKCQHCDECDAVHPNPCMAQQP